MEKETRKLTVKLSLPPEDWARLEKYAANDGKSLQEYLNGYFDLGIATALREGYLIDSLKVKSKLKRFGQALNKKKGGLDMSPEIEALINDPVYPTEEQLKDPRIQQMFTKNEKEASIV